MLESIHFQNFQCHEDKTIEFDPQISVFWGPTDAGKSSAIRGLIWVLLNQPRGMGFITHGKDFAANTLQIDGRTITRGRKGNYNYYSLDGGTPFEAFGTGVPSEIQKVLSVDAISIQRQLDPPFWFLLSPGQVSQELNSVVNLSLIDDALSFFVSKQKKSKLSVSLSEEKLDKAKARKKELSWIVGMESRLSTIEDQEKEIEELEKKANNLKSIIDYVDTIEDTRSRNLSHIQKLEEIIKIGEEIQTLEQKQESLQTVLKDIYNNKVKSGKLEQEIENMEFQIKQETDGKCPICGGDLEKV